MKTKTKEDAKVIWKQITLPFHNLTTDNTIGETGATSLSEALKSNITLVQLNLSCWDKRRHTEGIHRNHSSFHNMTTDNNFRDTGKALLSEALKSNTTLTKLGLVCGSKESTKGINLYHSIISTALEVSFVNMHSVFLWVRKVFCLQSQLWTSVSVSTDSVSTTQSPMIEVGTIALWHLAKACWVRVKREMKRGCVLIDGWRGSECFGVFHQNLSMSAHRPVLRLRGTFTWVS